MFIKIWDFLKKSWKLMMVFVGLVGFGTAISLISKWDKWKDIRIFFDSMFRLKPPDVFLLALILGIFVMLIFLIVKFRGFSNKNIKEIPRDNKKKPIKLLEENKDLKENIRELENQLKIKNTLDFKENAYYSVDAKGNKEEGPFCSNCWDTEEKLIRLHETPRHERWRCPNCRNYGGEIKA